MENASQKKSRKWRERIAFALGNLGHSAFYGALSTYFIVFVTSGMFDGVEKSIANKLIGLITGLVVIIRLAEVLVDPVIGNVVDNTQTKWGKFKPWQVIGSVVSSILLVVIFTGIFGLAKTNWILFAILFVIIFITLDVFYSFCDVAYWGMVPAISEDRRSDVVWFVHRLNRLERSDDHRRSGNDFLHFPCNRQTRTRTPGLAGICDHHRNSCRSFRIGRCFRHD